MRNKINTRWSGVSRSAAQTEPWCKERPRVLQVKCACMFWTLDSLVIYDVKLELKVI